MKRAFLPVVNSLFAVLMAVSTLAFAAEEKPAAKEPAAAKVDPAKGESIFTNGDNARGIPACASCHGPGGNSTNAQNPKLAGQHPAYIAKQLADFKADTKGSSRNNPVMSPIAKNLNGDDIKNIAAYLSAQAPKQGAAKNKDTIDLGKKIFRGGIAEKNVAACAGCHSANGAGIPNQFPRIAGQLQDYTVAQLKAFRDAGRRVAPQGARKNSPQMTTIASRLSDDEIEAVADYVAGLK